MYQTYIISIDSRKNYEEELKRTYVLEQRVVPLEEETRSLRTITRSITEVRDQEAQKKFDIENVGEGQ